MNSTKTKLKQLAEQIVKLETSSNVFSIDLACRNHAKQLKLAKDKARFIKVCAGRRGGKSTALCARAIDTCLTSAVAGDVYYLASSIDWCKRQIFNPILRPMLDRQKLTYETNESASLSVQFANGTQIIFKGADDLGDVKRFRGGKPLLIIIDEIQDIRDDVLTHLIEDAIDPSLADNKASLIVAGTPSYVSAGYWYRIWQNLKYSSHEFTMHDNPFLTVEDIKREIALVCERRGVTENDASIQREYFGRWVSMTNWLVYKYLEAKNSSGDLFYGKVTANDNGWRFAVGVDTGQVDRFAIVVIGQSHAQAQCHLIDEWVTKRGAEPTVTEVVNRLKTIRETYKPSAYFVDPAAAGKMLIAELTNVHGFPFVTAAVKTQRKGEVELVNDALRNGRIKLPKESATAQDFQRTLWDQDEAAKGKWEYAPVWHPDAADAFRYAYKGIYQNWYKPPDLRTPQQRMIDDETKEREKAWKQGARDAYGFAPMVDEYEEWKSGC